MAKNDIVVSGSGLPPSMIPPNMKDDQVPFSKKDCKLCASSYRVEAEELYDRTESLKRVHKFLTEDRAEEISYGAVRNHLKFHYEARSSNTLVKEFSGEVEQWLDLQQDQMAGLRRAMALIEREMVIIAAHGEGLPLLDRRKNAETVGKLAALLLSYRGKIEELVASKDGIGVVLNQLNVIFKQELKGVKSPETKQVVSNVFAKLKDSVGHFDIEDE